VGRPSVLGALLDSLKGAVTVIDLRTRQPRRPAGEAPAGEEVTRTLRAIRSVLRSPGDLVPDDDAIVGAVLGAALGAERAGLRGHLDALVDQGLLRRVFVGREVHLALVASPKEPKAAGEQGGEPAAPAAVAVTPAPAAVTGAPTVDPKVFVFQTRLKIDVELERALLYRVSIVIFGILAFVLLRAVVLDALGY
jgi:hypothetical protein